MRCMHAGPCLRCVFPEPPRPEACGRCSDAGVLGVIPGIIGTLQVRYAWHVVVQLAGYGLMRTIKRGRVLAVRDNLEVQQSI